MMMHRNLLFRRTPIIRHAGSAVNLPELPYIDGV
jgi:hypothetical protein